MQGSPGEHPEGFSLRLPLFFPAPSPTTWLHVAAWTSLFSEALLFSPHPPHQVPLPLRSRLPVQALH